MGGHSAANDILVTHPNFPPNLTRAVVNKCTACEAGKSVLVKPSSSPGRAPGTVPAREHFNHTVGIDYVCLTVHGPYVFMAVDHHTLLTCGTPSSSRDKETSFRNFTSSWITRHGWPSFAIRMDGERGWSLIRLECQRRGIEVQDTAPDSSFSNGICERRIRRLNEAVRTLFLHANFPPAVNRRIWGYTIRNAISCLNVSPLKRHAGSSPVSVSGTTHVTNPFYFGQPILYHSMPPPGILQKFSARWSPGYFVCSLSSAKLVILDAHYKVLNNHPFRVRASRGDSVPLSSSPPVGPGSPLPIAPGTHPAPAVPQVDTPVTTSLDGPGDESPPPLEEDSDDSDEEDARSAHPYASSPP